MAKERAFLEQGIRSLKVVLDWHEDVIGQRVDRCMRKLAAVIFRPQPGAYHTSCGTAPTRRSAAIQPWSDSSADGNTAALLGRARCPTLEPRQSRRWPGGQVPPIWTEDDANDEVHCFRVLQSGHQLP